MSGRGRRGGKQPSQSQHAGGRAQTGASSSTSGRLGNLSLGSAAPSPATAPAATSSSTLSQLSNRSLGSAAPSPATVSPAASWVTVAGRSVPKQPAMQQNPVQAPPAPVIAQQQVAKKAPTPESSSAQPTSSKIIKACPRPGYGSLGQTCDIRANHFLVDLGQKDPCQYDVTITPEVISKTRSREILNLLSDLYKQSHLGNMLLAYDGKKSVFTVGPLPFESKEFVVKLTESNGREKEYKVKIRFVSRKYLHDLRQFLSGSTQHDNTQGTIQALDVVLREAVSTTRQQIVGRSLFSTEFGKGVLGDGVEYWKGFYHSLRPTQMGLSLNIDMSARAFYEPKLVTEFVADFIKKDLTRPLTHQEHIKVKRALRGVRVEVKRGDYVRRYKVHALTAQPTNQLTFNMNDTGATMSVVQYFRGKYNINLQFPHLPAIQAGTDAKPIYLPMEICRIAGGQRYALKLNEKQVTKFLKATCQRPQDRENSIIKTMRSSMKSNKYNQLVKKDFEMEVNELMTTINARVLPPPSLKYQEARGTNSEVTPSVGRWKSLNQNMINPGTVNYWAVANFSPYCDSRAELLTHGIGCMCLNKGMVFNLKPLIPIYNSPPNNIEKALVDIQSRCKAQLKKVAPGNSLQLLIVILPEDKGAYARIKRVCETELGIVSQCCKPQYVNGCSMEYFENISFKINVKVGGRNVVLAAALANRLPYITERPTIIFGADVTHPSPGEDSSPSIAAVVASMDWPQVTKYKALLSAQPHRQEIIEDLYLTTTDARRGVVHSGLIRELLISFKKSTGHKPQRIIFYRDGVSEGQFNEVLMSEVDKIRKACASLQEGYMPPITFIVVQKRHHTRFFPVNHHDQSGNILPGSVVDTNICHPTQFDFYLCSHAGIKGTSRPTHYHVLYDENNFTADGVQDLTNKLCYTYQRCASSVSVVPPAYYAHLAAVRARCYMECGESSNSGASTSDGVAEVCHVPEIHDNVKNLMFFC